MILRGKHKSSLSELNSSALDKSISTEIDHGWALPITIESLQNIYNTGGVPLGVAEQFSINEKGGRYTKRRVTHDCSLPVPSGLSVNNQVQQESLQSFVYGFFLLRILHMISEMRNKCPTKLILIGKTDLEVACRRIHANATTASTFIVGGSLVNLTICLKYSQPFIF